MSKKELKPELLTVGKYRYVYELFIAALLCYTNKFGDEDVDEVRK